jgi:hypothetical protein
MNCMTDAVKAILDDAVKLCESVGYSNAGTVEFLVEPATGTGTFNSIPVIIRQFFTGASIPWVKAMSILCPWAL